MLTVVSRPRGEVPLLHFTLAASVVGSTYNSETVEFSGVGEYGVMIALAVIVKLARSVSVTAVDCDVRSDSVRATSVTLRSTATADENSTTPKNSVSMSGTITANSTAALARLSRTRPPIKPRARSEVFCIGITLIASRLDMEGRGGGEQALAVGGVAADVGDVVAEAGHDKRPAVERARHHCRGAARRRRQIG